MGSFMEVVLKTLSDVLVDVGDGVGELVGGKLRPTLELVPSAVDIGVLLEKVVCCIEKNVARVRVGGEGPL
jgi:hypothetical protein